MNKSEYLMILYDTLNDVPSDVRTGIVSEYRDYFNKELEKGRTEEEIIMSLGDPVTLAYAAKQMRGYGQKRNEDFNIPVRRKRGSGTRVGIIFIIIGVFVIMGTGVLGIVFNFTGLSDMGLSNKIDVNEYHEANLDSIKKIIIKNSSSDALIDTTTTDKVSGLLKGVVRNSDSPYLSMQTTGDTLLIEVKWPKKSVLFFSSNLDLHISVPKSFKGDIEYTSSSGNLEMSEMSIDNLILRSSSGDIEIQDVEINNRFKLSSVSGNCKIISLSANNMVYQSTSGDMFFTNIIVNEDILINSTSGNSKLSEIECNKLSIDSTSGDINIEEAQLNLLSVESKSGNVTVDNLDGAVQTETTSGDTSLLLSNVKDNVYIKSISGNINLYLPDNIGFTLNSKSASGNINCEFSLQDISKGKNYLTGVYGNGEVDISISATAGNINIKEN